MRTAFLSFCLLALFAAPTALAQGDGAVNDPEDILGMWTFQTSVYREGQCQMAGQMHVSSAEEPGTYTCEITANEVCTGLGESVVLQSCVARRVGNQVTVRSNIEQMLESKDAFVGLESSYAPDNFSLTVKSSRRMFGSLVSAVTAPVEFKRDIGGMS